MIKIGTLCAECDVTPRTIRWYEEYGLIGPDKDYPGPQKRYSKETAEMVRIIKLMQDLGYSLKEIKKILALSTSNRTAGKWATLRLRKELEKEASLLNQKIRLLHKNRKAIANILEDTKGCPDCASPDCGACPRLGKLRTLGRTA